MADGIELNSMSGGSKVSTDERTIGGQTEHVQRINDIGGTAIANGQAAPTSSAANIVSARDTRKLLTLINHGTVEVYVGVATVTTANGVKLPPGTAIDIATTAAVQGVTAAGTGAIHYVEVYDS